MHESTSSRHRGNGSVREREQLLREGIRSKRTGEATTLASQKSRKNTIRTGCSSSITELARNSGARTASRSYEFERDKVAERQPERCPSNTCGKELASFGRPAARSAAIAVGLPVARSSLALSTLYTRAAYSPSRAPPFELSRKESLQRSDTPEPDENSSLNDRSLQARRMHASCSPSQPAIAGAENGQLSRAEPRNP